MIEYTITLNSRQIRMTLKAVELLMRLKIKQAEELPYALMLKEPDYAERRDAAMPNLRAAFEQLFHGKEPAEWKDQDWYCLNCQYQVIRHALQQAEYPDSTGVDSYDPVQLSADEELPKISWRKEDA